MIHELEEMIDDTVCTLSLNSESFDYLESKKDGKLEPNNWFKAFSQPLSQTLRLCRKTFELIN